MPGPESAVQEASAGKSHPGPRTWVVAKILVPFWVLDIIRYLVVSGPKSGP